MIKYFTSREEAMDFLKVNKMRSVQWRAEFCVGGWAIRKITIYLSESDYAEMKGGTPIY